MKPFDTILEIKTGKRNLSQKAIFLKNKSKKWKVMWQFFPYYYDEQRHTFYINGFNKSLVKNKKLIGEVVNEAFKREQKQIKIDTFTDIIKAMQRNKKPKVFYFHTSKDDNYICINQINLTAIRNFDLEILKLIVSSYS